MKVFITVIMFFIALFGLSQNKQPDKAIEKEESGQEISLIYGIEDTASASGTFHYEYSIRWEYLQIPHQDQTIGVYLEMDDGSGFKPVKNSNVRIGFTVLGWDRVAAFATIKLSKGDKVRSVFYTNIPTKIKLIDPYWFADDPNWKHI